MFNEREYELTIPYENFLEMVFSGIPHFAKEICLMPGTGGKAIFKVYSGLLYNQFASKYESIEDYESINY
jgi:hypothetical protein